MFLASGNRQIFQSQQEIMSSTLTQWRGLCLFVAKVLGGASEADKVTVPRFFFSYKFTTFGYWCGNLKYKKHEKIFHIYVY